MGFSDFRLVGDGYRQFAAWVRELKGYSGVYVIRDLAGTVLYCGESHTGRLYHTLTRHFQAWSGETAGPTYHRDRVDVSVSVVPTAEAVSLQNAVILALNPEDNRRVPAYALVSDEDDAPPPAEDDGTSDIPF